MHQRALYVLIAAVAMAAGCGREALELTRGACDWGQVEIGNTCTVIAGRPCDQDGSCLGGTCIVDGDTRYCTTACAADTECPAGYVCTTAGDTRYCQKDRGILPGRCRTDKDCPRCAICTGGACRPSDVCVQYLCTTDDQCGRCRQCVLGACEPVRNCGPVCVSSFDCLPEEVCAFDYQGGLSCLPRTGGAFSAPCSLQTGAQCTSNICLYGEGVGAVYETYCSHGCTDKAHSSDCEPGFRCREYPPFGDGSLYCTLPDRDFPVACDSNYQCPSDLVCRYATSKSQKEIVTYCAEGVPDGRGLGRSCGPDSPCLTGVCPENGICTVPCSMDNDCPEAYLCMPLKTAQFSTEQLGFTGCLNYAFVKGTAGDLCPAGKDDCESGLCVDNDGAGPLPYCADPCTEQNPTCPDGHTCKWNPDGNGACAYEVYQGACGADGDCGALGACASDDAAGNRYPACRAIKGDEGKPGEPCNDGASLSCTSGLCLLTNFCSAFCRGSYDCPDGFICSFGYLNDGSGNLLTIEACFPAPGSLQYCARDAGCPAADEVCRAFIWDRTGEVRTWCRKLDPAWKPDGGACADNSECASGVCLGNKTCTALCAADTDCGPDEVCAVVATYLTETYGRPVRACRPAPSTDETGQPCADDLDCMSGSCATDLPGAAFCFDRCRDNFDCLGSYTICRIEPGHGNICTPAEYRPVE